LKKKWYKKQKLINNIKCNWFLYKGQDEVSKGISGLYTKIMWVWSLALKTTKVLDDLIDPNQTAYVNGRWVKR
jgi:hypothetical protein